MLNKKMINRWTYDQHKNEIAFYNESKTRLVELAKMPFYPFDYEKLPKDDKKCLDYLYNEYKRHNAIIIKERQEKAFLEKEYNKQRKYLKDPQYYIDNAISTYNGTCFKDDMAFESGKGVCYISEYELIDLENGKPLIECMNTRATIKRDIKRFGSKKLNIDFIYETLDWQAPSSLISELD